MYEALVARVRYHIQKAEFMGLKEAESTLLLKETADAIEKMDNWWAQADKLTKMLEMPHWIPVTERLPNGEAERYLVAASLANFGLWVSICYYADNLEEFDEYDFENEKHGGFYWYDDEYGYREKLGVQYWMPLPEPPKEESSDE